MPKTPPADPLDAEAIERILRRLRPKLLRVLAHHGVPPEDAEDLLQQALLALIYKQRAIQSPEAWLLGTLRNTCLRYWRRRRRERVEPVADDDLEWLSGPSPPGQELGDLRRDLAAVLARLPTRCRDVLKLRYTLGFRPREVAEVTGYRADNVRKITSRCLQALEKELEQSDKERLASDLQTL
ncbi:MAG: RNA polymerase sigma factor [Acidobacteriota bacterium]